MLLVVKSNFIRYFTIIGVVDGAKNSVVIHGQLSYGNLPSFEAEP